MCVGVRAYAQFATDLALSSPLLLTSPCIYTILSVGRGGVRHLLSQSLSSIKFPPPITLHLLSVCNYLLSMSFSLSLLCFMLLCYLLLLPRSGWGWASNNITRIRRHHRYPLFILLDLIGILTNDLMSIVVNLIAETLHGKNKEGLIKMDRQFFNDR